MIESRARNVVAKLLGGLWLVDGLLQLQPLMFGQTFVTSVLVPNLADQPAFVRTLVAAGISLWSTHPALWNSCAALLQITIGILLFFPLSSKHFKFGAYVSIAWGIVVWICGEGAGLLFTGNANFYTGAPGAVLLYVLLAVLLLAPKRVSARTYPKIAGGIFLFGALLQLQSEFWSVDGVQGTVMAAMMEPVHTLLVFPAYLYDIMGVHPTLTNLFLIGVLLILGLLLAFKPTRAAGITSLAFLFIAWWAGQDFGMITTVPSGVATDPSTAPLVALFLVPLFVRTRESAREKLLKRPAVFYSAGALGFVILLFALPYVLPAPPFSETEQYLEVVGPVKAQQTALQLTEEGGFSDGHMYLHEVGWYALATYGIDGVAYCLPYFDHGCYNGFMMQMTSTSSVETALDVCQGLGSYALGGCIHGAGHAALMFNDFDVPKALAQCSAWTQEFGTSTVNACSFGVFMENAEPDAMETMTMGVGETPPPLSAQPAWQLRSSDPAFPCDSPLVAQVYRSGCWRMQMVVDSNLLPIARSVALCDSLAYDDQKASCFQGLADGYGTFPNTDADTALSACGSSTGAWRDVCLLDFVQRAYENGFGAALPQQICPHATSNGAQAYCAQMMSTDGTSSLGVTFSPSLLTQ